MDSTLVTHPIIVRTQVLASTCVLFLEGKSLLDKYLLGVERPITCKYLIPGTDYNCKHGKDCLYRLGLKVPQRQQGIALCGTTRGVQR